MIKFEKTETYGWDAAMRGMRNPKNSWGKADTDIEYRQLYKFPDSKTFVYSLPRIGPNDMRLAKILKKAGTDHRKYLRQIVVYVDITAPLYWWKEFDTYKVGTVANSCSTMHKIQEKEFTLDDFSHEHLGHPVGLEKELFEIGESPLEELERTIDNLNKSRRNYNKADAKIKYEELNEKNLELFKKARKFWWWQMIQLLPSSYNQKRTVMLSYEVLNNIAKSRKGHPLDEWRETFMDWMRSLPYSKELIFGEE